MLKCVALYKQIDEFNFTGYLLSDSVKSFVGATLHMTEWSNVDRYLDIRDTVIGI